MEQIVPVGSGLLDDYYKAAAAVVVGCYFVALDCDVS